MSGYPRFCLLVGILYLVVTTLTYYALCKWRNPCTSASSASSSSSVLTSLEQMLCCSSSTIPIIRPTPLKHSDPNDPNDQHGQSVIRYTNATSIGRESQGPSRDSNVTLPKREDNQQKQQQQNKVILFWTRFFGVQDFGFGFGQEPFIRHNCSVTNCVTTNDKALLKQASAIVFHNRNVFSKTVFPSVRFTNQSYVFFLQESPTHQGMGLTGFKDVYNLTMTYRRDSDIPVPYGSFASGSRSAIPDEQVTKIVEGKKKLVAWFVSNCRTASRRELYVKELQKHIGVDIYGACGPLKCPRGAKSNECDVMLERDYKFYIAFENSVCKDYVTEKLFRALARYVVPVVYGGGNYSAIAPPHSVINVRDYASPKHLADYLRMLAEDDVQYRKYFEWKRQYRDALPLKKGFCKLCEIINAADTHPKIYHDLQKWWNTDANCDNNFIHELIH